jgi:hypothetical protein
MPAKEGYATVLVRKKREEHRMSGRSDPATTDSQPV